MYSKLIYDSLSKKIPTGSETYYFCPGNPFVTIDLFGPAVGSVLKSYGISNVFGTLDDPLSSDDKVKFNYNLIKDKFIVVIDAEAAFYFQNATLGKINIKNGTRVGGINSNIAPKLGNLAITYTSCILTKEQEYKLPNKEVLIELIENTTLTDDEIFDAAIDVAENIRLLEQDKYRKVV